MKRIAILSIVAALVLAGCSGGGTPKPICDFITDDILGPLNERVIEECPGVASCEALPTVDVPDLICDLLCKEIEQIEQGLLRDAGCGS